MVWSCQNLTLKAKAMTKPKTNLFDVLVAMVMKGQAPLVFVLLLFLAVILKCDSYQTIGLIKDFTGFIGNICKIGWVLWIITVIAWIIQSKKKKLIYREEIERCGDEKSRLQNMLNPNRDFKSSNRQK